jgi:hypothetical protein
VRAIGIATGSFTAAELLGAGAELVLATLEEFPAWYRARRVRARDHAVQRQRLLQRRRQRAERLLRAGFEPELECPGRQQRPRQHLRERLRTE